MADARVQGVTDIRNDEPIRLSGWHDEINDSVCALMFGELVKRTIGIVEHYHSDLFRDAQWVIKFVLDGDVRTFYWAAREFGTNIGCDLRLVAYSVRDDEPVYEVSVTTDRGMWYVTFHPVEREAK